jgi:hypothetical protein
MKIYLILSFLLISLLGCTFSEITKTPSMLNVNELKELVTLYRIPVIIDTTNLDTIGIEDMQPPYVYHRQIMYAGINKDTIYLPDTNSIVTEEVKWERKEIGQKTVLTLAYKKTTNIQDSLVVNLLVDVNRIVHQKLQVLHINESDSVLDLKPLKFEYEITKNHALIVYNNTLDTLKWIDVLPITIEAKNKEGDWQIIQNTRGATCGSSRTLVSFPQKKNPNSPHSHLQRQFYYQIKSSAG